MKYRHIVFDVDGTLIDTLYSTTKALQDVLLAATGKLYPLEALTFSYGIPGIDTLRQLAVEDPWGALKQWEDKLEDYREHDHVFEGIPGLLAALHQAGFGLGVVTSRTRAEFDIDFAKLDIARYFQTVICADDTEGHKPLPDPLLKYLERTGCARDGALYIGDSVYDQQCAASAGVDFGLAGWGATEEREAPWVFRVPADVGAMLKLKGV